MPLTLLQIVQAFTKRTGLPVPTSVQSSADPQVMQMMGLLDEFLEDLQTRRVFQQNTLECVFTSTAGENQGNIQTLCPWGFQGMILESMFDRTQRLPLWGGLGSSEWQARKAFQITGPLYEFRIWENQLMFSPALPADHEIAFEYMSSYFVVNNSGTGNAYRQYWQLDTDTFLLDDSLPISWLRWKWKAEKGLEYAEEFRKYEALVSTKGAKTGRPTVVNMAHSTRELQAGIIVPISGIGS